MKRPNPRHGFVLLALLTVVQLACNTSSSRRRVMVLGLDGLDPSTVALLISEGKLPNLARMQAAGAHGNLESQEPLLSPIVWTTIATGKTPDAHGIGHFVAIDPKTGESLPVTSRMRRTKALWNILSDLERTVAVVGWWATWPAEPVNGALVSDHTCYHFLFPQVVKGAESRVGVTHPAQLLDAIAPLVRRPAEITASEIARFVTVTDDEVARPFAFDDDLSHLRWALAAADSYRAIGLKLWRDERPDVLMVYTEATDSVAHLFGHLFRAKGLAGELLHQQEKFGRAVEQTYIYADEIVGQYIQAMDAQTTLVVLSDHGFELGAVPDDPSKTRDMRRVSERYHRKHGVLYLYGAGVRPGRLNDARIVDVAPTILALTGLGAARDMPGRVLSEALLEEAPARDVDTFESVADPSPPVHDPPPHDTAVDDEIRQRLQSLGYLPGGGERQGGSDPQGGDLPSSAKAAVTPLPRDVQPSPMLPRSPQGERNLAAIEFEAKRYQKSIEIYRGLVAENPDDSGLQASLGGALAAVGQYDEALKHLDRALELDPLSVGGYHNRAAILERQGKVDEAILTYGKALRYQPGYAPSRAALTRLTGSANVREPRDDAERRAAEFASAAAEAARRGDYDEATKLLEQAQKLAPKYVLVWQYQSNVAYLKGDVDGAIRALEEALELEPDNALFRQNIDHLRNAKATARVPKSGK